MTLLIVILTIVIGHFFTAIPIFRRFDWVLSFEKWLQSNSHLTFLRESAWGLVMLIGAPSLLLGLVVWYVSWNFTVVGEFVLSLTVLLYCWGPRDLDHDVKHCLQELTDNNCNDETIKILVVEELTIPVDSHRETLVGSIFLAGLERWFMPLFWFVLFGPVGVFVVRISQELNILQIKHEKLPTEWNKFLNFLMKIWRWPVAFLMTACLAIVANFDVVIGACKKYFAKHRDLFKKLDSGFLTLAACALFRLHPDDDLLFEELTDHKDYPPGCLKIEQSLNLLWRVLIAWITIIAILSVFGILP